MLTRRQAVAVAVHVSSQVLQVHGEDLKEYATVTGSFPMWMLNVSVAKKLHRWVKRSRTIDEAITQGMQVFAADLKDQGYVPLQQVIYYRQALGTLMELASAKFGSPQQVEEAATRADEEMVSWLGLDEWADFRNQAARGGDSSERGTDPFEVLLEPRDGSDRQRQALEVIGESIDQASQAYESAKAQDPRIETAIDIVKVAPDAQSLRSALEFAKAIDALYPIGLFRMEWVMAAVDALGRLHIKGQMSRAEAKEAVDLAIANYGKTEMELAQSPIIWAMGAERNRVTDMFEGLIDQLDAREVPSVSDTNASKRIFELEDLRRTGAISDEEFRTLKARAVEAWEDREQS